MPLPRVLTIVRTSFFRLLLLVALVAATSATAPPAAQAAANQWMTFEAPGELLDDRREATLDEIQSFGIDRVRTLVYWEKFSPSPNSRTRPDFDASDPAAYPDGIWAPLDRLVASTRRRGMRVHMTLTGPVPRWATRYKTDNVRYPNVREFEKWVTAVGRRYGSDVSVWSVWNEPNHPRFLGPQRNSKGTPLSPRIYRRLYQAAERGLNATGNSNDLILFGETLPRGSKRNVNPLDFMRRALCLDSRYKKSSRCGKLNFDGYAHHAYMTTAGPRAVTPNRDEVTTGSINRLTVALDRAARAGAIRPNRGIYITEFGVQSYPDPISGVSLQRQAEYLAMAERMTYANPRVRGMSQYLMRDDQPREGRPIERYSGFETGLRFADGRKKPAYSGFRLPLSAAKVGRRDVLWGHVRPAAGRTEVTIQIKTPGKKWRDLMTKRTNSRGVFGASTRRRSKVQYRVTWVSPSGETLRGTRIRAF